MIAMFAPIWRISGERMKRTAALAFLAGFTLCVPSASAQESASDPGFKASALRDACDPPASATPSVRDAGDRICQAYLRGVADGLFMLGMMQQGDAPVCLPNDGPVSPAEAKSEFEDYLADHPDAADHSAGVTAAFAIIAAHPCE
jgi:Rap1a immunity proteins